jgi:hypothetical protein
MPGLDADGYVKVPAPTSSAFGSFPAAARDETGWVLSWRGNDRESASYVQWLSEDFGVVGEPLIVPVEFIGKLSLPQSERAIEIFDGRVWLATETGSLKLELTVIEDRMVVERRVLVSHSLADDCARGDCPTPPPFDARNLEMVTWQDELWLGFADQTHRPMLPEPSIRPYRMVRVKPGCTYRAAYDELM